MTAIKDCFYKLRKMERKEIAQLASQMKDKKDLLALLNRIKRDEFAQIGMGDSFHTFVMQHINYYCNPRHAFHRFNHFKIKKKTGGFRQITAPRNKSYKFLLRCLNELLKAVYTPSQYAMGFTEGRSAVDNAEKHKGMNYVFNIDLKDFFPSIEQPRIWKRLQLKPFEFPVPVASAIAGLCCMKEQRELPDGSKKDYYVLPQGAPTSPLLTNAICDKLDFLLSRLAKRFGLNYTRYADDITFSSMHNVYQKDGEFRRKLFEIIEKQNFKVNPDKTRLQKKGARQEVTGIIVSEKLNVTQKYVRDIRNLLFIWERHGYGAASARFLPVYAREKGHVKKGNPNLVNVLDGKLMYLKMVKGEDDSVYLRLHTKFVKLSKSLNLESRTNDLGITYVDTTPLKKFEEKHQTVVEIRWTSPQENEEQKRSSRYAKFMLGDNAEFASVNKSITTEEEGTKEALAISKCRNAKGEEFWLIHKQSKVIVQHHRKPVDIDELNADLDLLLNT